MSAAPVNDASTRIVTGALPSHVAITTWARADQSTGGKTTLHTWSELVSLYGKAGGRVRAKADLPAPSFVTVRDECTPGDCAKSEEKGRTLKRHRCDQAVMSVNALVLDSDDGATWESAESWCRDNKLACILYESPSHTEEHPRWRIVIPLAQTWNDAASWGRAYSTIRLFIEAQTSTAFDRKCSNASRIFYPPTRPTDDVPARRVVWIGGDALDLAATLATMPKIEAPAAREYSQADASSVHDLDDEDRVAFERWAQAAFSHAVDAVARSGKGDRNDTLNRQTFTLARRFGVSGLLSLQMIERVMLESAKGAGLPESEARATIASAVGAGRANPMPVRDLIAEWRKGRRVKPGKKAPARTAPPEHDPETGEVMEEDYGEALENEPSENEDPRPKIIISTDAEKDVDAAIAALASGDAPIFQRGSILVRVTREASKLAGTVRPKGTPTMSRCPSPRLAELLARHARWFAKKQSRGVEVEVKILPPMRVVQQIEARGEWQNIRPLDGIVESPVLRSGGTILETPGYDAETGLLFEPNGIFESVPQNPSQGDACRACADLLETVADFAFVSDAHRTAWLASVLTPIARYGFEGPSPLTLYEASVRGSGKTFLARIVGLIVTGREPFALSEVTDHDEERKRITSIAMQGDRLVLLDNVTRLGSPALEAALTSTYWQDRVLGSSDSVRLPLFVSWMATGNNVLIRGDMIRRINLVRLEPDCEQPERRTGFRHPDLFRWVADNRGRLVRAALTILRAYHAAGRPRVDMTPWGSFEGWSAAVRAPLIFAGMPDPYETRAKLEEGNSDTGTLSALLRGWRELGKVHGDRRDALTASAALGILERSQGGYETLRSAIAELADDRKPLTGKSLGYILRSYRGRLCGGMRLESADNSDKVAMWFVTGGRPEGAGDAGHAGDVFPPTRDRSLSFPSGGGVTKTPAATGGSIAGIAGISGQEVRS